MSGWTEERVETLVKLWGERLSASVIGGRIGMTKNAVIGKAHRLKLSRQEDLAAFKARITAPRAPKPAPTSRSRAMPPKPKPVTPTPSASPPRPSPPKLPAISVDLNTDTATVGATRVKLPPIPAEFLYALSQSPTRSLTYHGLADAIWGRGLGPDDWLKALSIYAWMVRKRIAPHGVGVLNEERSYRLIPVEDWRPPSGGSPTRAPIGQRKCRKCRVIKPEEAYSQEMARRGCLNGAATCNDCLEPKRQAQAPRTDQMPGHAA
jgi:hypothetical protein